MASGILTTSYLDENILLLKGEDNMKLEAQLRDNTGTSASKKYRRDGFVPASIFGSEMETTSILINRHDYEAVIREVGFNGVFDLEIAGDDTYQVFVKEQDNAPVKDIIYHVDLQSFKAGETVVMTIPVYLQGDDELEGIVANQSISEIEVEVEPAKAPAEFYVDVANLEVGDSVSIEELDIPEYVTVLEDGDATVVSISVAEEEPEEPEEVTADEPELIGAEDEEDEEE